MVETKHKVGSPTDLKYEWVGRGIQSVKVLAMQVWAQGSVAQHTHKKAAYGGTFLESQPWGDREPGP